MLLPLLHTTLPLDGAYRTVAEQAVLMWLEPLHVRQGGYLRTLDHYNGQLDTEKAADSFWEAMVGALPGVLVASGDEVFDRQSLRSVEWLSRAEIEILVFSDNRRGRKHQNIGDEHGLNDATVDPGCYVIMQDVFTRLTGRSTGDCRMGRYVPEYTRVVLQAPDVTMWNIRFELEWNLKVNTDAELDSPVSIVDFHHKHNLVDDDDPPPSTINPVAEGLTST